MSSRSPETVFSALSKRAARRLIQRAFVLVGRDRQAREHIRQIRLTSLYRIEDWNLSWTLCIDRGKLAVERRPAKQPDLKFTWQSAEDFFRQVEAGKFCDEGFQFDGDFALRRAAEPVLSAFCLRLQALLANPIDENGTRLA